MVVEGRKLGCRLEDESRSRRQMHYGDRDCSKGLVTLANFLTTLARLEVLGSMAKEI